MNYNIHKELKLFKENIFNWLFKLTQDEFINLFKFKNSNFAILILRIGLKLQKHHKYYMKLKEDKNYDFNKYDFKKIDLEELFEFKVENCSKNYNTKLIRLFTKKIRLLSIDEIYDTLTFSKSSLIDRKSFLENLDNVLNNNLFLRSDNFMNNKENSIKFSNWFNFKNYNHFILIIIAHIEYNVIESFRNSSNKLNSTILIRDEIFKYFEDLSIIDKNDLIENAIKTFDNFSIVKNLIKHDENKFKEKNFLKNLKREEYVFYIIFYEKYVDYKEKINILINLGNNFRKYFSIHNSKKFDKKVWSTIMYPNFSQIIDMISILFYWVQNNLILKFNLKNLDDINSYNSENKKKKKKKRKKKKKNNKNNNELIKEEEVKNNDKSNEEKEKENKKKLQKSFLSEKEDINYFENKKYYKLKSRENSLNNINIKKNYALISENNSVKKLNEKKDTKTDIKTDLENNDLKENKNETNLRFEYFKLSELKQENYNFNNKKISNDDDDEYLFVEENSNKFKKLENKYTNTSPLNNSKEKKNKPYKSKKKFVKNNKNNKNYIKKKNINTNNYIKDTKKVYNNKNKSNQNNNNKYIFKKWNENAENNDNSKNNKNSGRKKQISKENTQKYISFYFYKILTNQIKNILKNVNLRNNKTKIIKELAINRLLNILYHTYDMNLNFKIYGSYKTKLITPFSDIDLSIVGLKTYSRSFILDVLSKYDNALKNLKFIKECKPILTANIPVIKLEIDMSIDFEPIHELTKNKDYNISNKNNFFKDDFIIKIDITVDNIDENNSSTGEKTTNFILSCIKNYNTFFDFIWFMKIIMGYHNLNNPYIGGLNSYGLSIMYIAFLNIDKRFLNQELSNCILKFLSFYSSKFNPFTQGINVGYNLVNIKNPYFKIEGITENLNIMDPTSNCNKNCTPTSYNIGIIFEAFKFWTEKSKNLMLLLSNKIDDNCNQNTIKKIVYEYFEKIDLIKEIFGYKFNN